MLHSLVSRLHGMFPVTETPKRLKSSRCLSTWEERTHGRVSSTQPSPFLYVSHLVCQDLLDWQTMGIPTWDIRGVKPDIDLERTMISLEILFMACPTWIFPFAYGGPSCEGKMGFSLIQFLTALINFASSHSFAKLVL